MNGGLHRHFPGGGSSTRSKAGKQSSAGRDDFEQRQGLPRYRSLVAHILLHILQIVSNS